MNQIKKCSRLQLIPAKVLITLQSVYLIITVIFKSHAYTSASRNYFARLDPTPTISKMAKIPERMASREPQQATIAEYVPTPAVEYLCVFPPQMAIPMTVRRPARQKEDNHNSAVKGNEKETDL